MVGMPRRRASTSRPALPSDRSSPLGADLAFEDDGRESALGYVGRFSPMLLLLRFLAPETARRVRGDRVGALVSLRPYALDTAAIGGLVGAATAFLPFLREMLDPDDGVLRATSKRAMLIVRAEGAAGIVSRAGVGVGWKRGVVAGREFFNHEGGGAWVRLRDAPVPARGPRCRPADQPLALARAQRDGASGLRDRARALIARSRSGAARLRELVLPTASPVCAPIDSSDPP